MNKRKEWTFGDLPWNNPLFLLFVIFLIGVLAYILWYVTTHVASDPSDW